MNCQIISPARIDLLGIAREMQFGICNHGELRASPHTIFTVAIGEPERSKMVKFFYL